MASVKLVYETLADLVNKDLNGFIGPAQFNNYAQLAQLKIYNRLFGQLKQAQQALKAGLDRGRDKSRVKQIEEDLAYFAKSETKGRDSATNEFLKPDDLSRIISITTSGDILLSSSTRTPVEIIYDEDKIERILLSDVSKPTETFPVALVSDNIEVYPEAVKKIRIRYYKIPEGKDVSTGARTASQPSFGYTTVNGSAVYSATGSVDFELPDHYVNELVLEIAEMAGITLRDGSVSGYAGSEGNQINAEK
jgi:hypothetical protein